MKNPLENVEKSLKISGNDVQSLAFKKQKVTKAPIVLQIQMNVCSNLHY